MKSDWSGGTVRAAGPFPMLGANDRSRWITVRALLEEGTYSIGKRDPADATAKNPAGDTGPVFEDDWKTIDKVLDPQTQRYYSSKPPWLATWLRENAGFCGEYSGLEIWIRGSPLYGIVLLTFNWPPFLMYMLVLAAWARHEGWSTWSSAYLLLAGGMGTFASSFAVTLNNHLPATFAVAVALLFLRRAIEHRSGPSSADFLIAGFFAGCAASLELPALCFAVAGLITAIDTSRG